MDVEEQMMMQVWLGNLRRMLDDGEVEAVKAQLDQALSRIDEDQAVLRATGEGSAVSGHGDA